VLQARRPDRLAEAWAVLNLMANDTVTADAPPLRIGSVPYLNAVPLTRGLEDQVLFAPPAQLATLLEQDQLDAALLSITEALLKDRYEILEGVAIASLGEVKSVLLAHRRPLAQLTEVFCDQASLTSVNLLRVLLAEQGLAPAFRLLPDYQAAAACEAVLLIGDPALDFSRQPHDHEIWDLGAAWYELTRLPFVYAAWLLPRHTPNPAVRLALREAKEFGMDTLDYIIRQRPEYDYDFRKDYLGWHIHYHLGSDEKRGVARFAE
jgi:chorismate dehydratase